MRYIYPVFYDYNIANHLKAKLKAAMLVAALLVSFFCISGYVSPSATCNTPTTKGQIANSPLRLKGVIHYKRALSSFCKVPYTNPAFARQTEITERFLVISVRTRVARLRTHFISIKHVLAYPVRHLSLAADNS